MQKYIILDSRQIRIVFGIFVIRKPIQNGENSYFQARKDIYEVNKLGNKSNIFKEYLRLSQSISSNIK